MTQAHAVDLVQQLTTFVCIADKGSISHAARTLRLSVSMASRHLRALEEELGVSLVRRTTRRLDLTEAGQQLLPRARRLLAGLEEARQAVRPGKQATGLVIMSVPVSFGLAMVASLVPTLLAKHPRLSLDVRFDDRAVDLLGDGVDLALRVGIAPPDSPFVVSRRIASYERVLCASPPFLAEHGVPESVEALASAPCIILGASPARWQFETSTGPKSVIVKGRLRSSSVLALRDAALAGLGVAQLPSWLVTEDLATKRLVPVLEGAVLPGVRVLGLIHSNARRSNNLRVVQDFLAAQLPRSLLPRLASG